MIKAGGLYEITCLGKCNGKVYGIPLYPVKHHTSKCWKVWHPDFKNPGTDVRQTYCSDIWEGNLKSLDEKYHISE